MALQIDGVEMTNLQIDGAEMDIGQIDGTKVFQKATPYTITDFSAYDWTFSQPNGEGQYEHDATNNRVYVSSEKTSGNYAYGRMTADLETKGCNKIRVKYSVSGGNSGSIMGNAVAKDTSGEWIGNISGSSISFWIQSQDHGEGKCTITVTEIYFYYE